MTFWLESRVFTVIYVLLIILCCVGGLAYGFARILLVVKPVISLRRLPVQAYVIPTGHCSFLTYNRRNEVYRLVHFSIHLYNFVRNTLSKLRSA